jgi:uncharacterized membrane protein
VSIRKQVVLAFFVDEAAADAAVESLEAWDDDYYDIKLNAIGVLALDAEGKVKTRKLGRRTTPKGVGVGVALAILVATGPVGAIGLPVLGGVAGALHRKGLGLTSSERERIAAELAGGKAAVGVLVSEDQARAVAAKLAELGGEPETHDVPAEAEAEVEAVAEQIEAEASADA